MQTQVYDIILFLQKSRVIQLIPAIFINPYGFSAKIAQTQRMHIGLSIYAFMVLMERTTYTVPIYSQAAFHQASSSSS